MRPNEPKGERKNMKMTFRWYGSQSDKITLKQIKQIPGCTGLTGVILMSPLFPLNQGGLWVWLYYSLLWGSCQ